MNSHKNDVKTPEEINKKELMDYYGYEGKLGGVKYYLRYMFSWSLQFLAKVSPHPAVAIRLQRARGAEIGNHVFIGSDVNLDDIYPSLIKIEDYVSIGMRTLIFCHSNPTCSIEIKKNYYPRLVASTTIKRGAWIAPGCIILAGITIGENSIVGAGSVVVKDVEPYTIVAGNPARLIKRIHRLEPNEGYQ